MADDSAARLDVRTLLAAVEDAPPFSAADVLGERLGSLLGAREVAFLIADFSGHALVRLGHSGSSSATRTQGDETAERVSLTGSAHGRALATQTVDLEHGVDGTRVFAPVTNRGEAIGVLELVLDEAPGEDVLAEVAAAAHTLAYVVIANRRFTDVFEWGQRSVPLSLAAEIQHRLLPNAYTCEAGQFTVAGWLEPAGNVGGDTFDFALQRDTLHLSMTDAMGHEVGAALLATVMVGSLRNARRAGVGLAEQVRLANLALADHARDSGFVTGQVARIDLGTGTAGIVNAGHPLPLRLRDGRVDRVDLQVDPPFGVVRGHEYRVQAAAGAGRPSDVLHRRHAGAQHRQRRHREHGGGRRGDASTRSRPAPHAGHPRGDRRRTEGRRDRLVLRLARRTGARADQQLGRRSVTYTPIRACG